MPQEGPRKPRESNEKLFTSRRRRRAAAGPPVWGLAVLVILVLAAIGVWLWLRSREAPGPGGTPPPAVDTARGPGEGTDPSARTPASEEEPFVLPGLDASDEAVRRLAEGLTAHPRLTAWLAPEDLVRRFVEAVVDVSRGSSPRSALEMLAPTEPFQVQESGDRLVVDPESYRRYDLLAQVMTSVDAQNAAEMYRRLLPLFREAYRELGFTERSWEETLARAVRNLVSVEVPEGPLEVREHVGRYLYVDPSVEDLTPAEKHLLRLGPENAFRVQDKIREIAGYLNLPPVPEGPAGEEGMATDTAMDGR